MEEGIRNPLFSENITNSYLRFFIYLYFSHLLSNENLFSASEDDLTTINTSFKEIFSHSIHYNSIRNPELVHHVYNLLMEGKYLKHKKLPCKQIIESFKNGDLNPGDFTIISAGRTSKPISLFDIPMADNPIPESINYVKNKFTKQAAHGGFIIYGIYTDGSTEQLIYCTCGLLIYDNDPYPPIPFVNLITGDVRIDEAIERDISRMNPYIENMIQYAAALSYQTDFTPEQSIEYESIKSEIDVPALRNIIVFRVDNANKQFKSCDYLTNNSNDCGKWLPDMYIYDRILLVSSYVNNQLPELLRKDATDIFKEYGTIPMLDFLRNPPPEGIGEENIKDEDFDNIYMNCLGEGPVSYTVGFVSPERPNYCPDVINCMSFMTAVTGYESMTQGAVGLTLPPSVYDSEIPDEGMPMPISPRGYPGRGGSRKKQRKSRKKHRKSRKKHRKSKKKIK